MSTSPTLISWRRKSSVRKLSSANFISVRSSTACPCMDARHVTSLLTYLHLFRFVEDETSKTGKVPALAGTAGHPHAETYSCQTSQSEYSPYSAADPVRQLARYSKDC